jgi:2-hydroxycyclohexanecarboxyl-CoA dehydrogenase
VEATLVTGGASGIGAACARALAERGLRVAVLDLAEAPAADLSLVADVRDAAAVAAAVDRVEDELGPIAALVTAAGHYEQAPVGETGVDRWRRMIDVHVGGTVNACRPVYRRMLARGSGAICTIGSELGLMGDPDAWHYASAKAAIHAFTKTLAIEAATHGVRVNCVAPGPTDTPLLVPAHRSAEALAALPLGRLVRPEEIAAAVLFVLFAPHNMVGQVLSPNAGAVI